MNIEIIIVQFSNKIPTTVALHLFISLSLSSSWAVGYHFLVSIYQCYVISIQNVKAILILI